MSIFGFILAFLPWLLFLFIAGHSLLTLKIAIIVSFVTAIIMGIARIHRGVILWGGIAFFSFAAIAVLLLNNMWAVHHMGMLASGTLFVSALFSIIIKKPFVMDYARDHVEEKYWDSPEFLRSCTIITSVWCLVFLLNVALNAVKLYHRGIPGWIFEVTQYIVLFSGVIFTNFYSKHASKQRASDQSKS
jgi:hypothetical protein